MNEWARTWGLRLLALGIAIGIWFNASVEDRLVVSEKVVEASVTYNSPRGFIITSPGPQSVNVRLRGTKKAIRQLNPYLVSVQVDLSQRQIGLVNISLEAKSVQTPDGLEAVSVEPKTVRVDLEREVGQRVPVVPEIVGKPASGAIRGEPEVSPSQVLVTGPEPMLARLNSLPTRPINLDGHTFTFEEKVEVVSPNPLIQIAPPGSVTVTVPITPPGTANETPQPQQEKEKGKPT
ncbi:MAG TPA: CdaR family protein [Thermoanaerobaculia bacterium]|nr:CdaR family protein [Thermoanaerobaculia bacterium]